MNWLISANSNIYDHSSSFEHFGSIDWHQGNTKYNVDDIIYIYCTRPVKKIRYKCIVRKTCLAFSEIRDDREYWNDQVKYEKSLSGSYMHLELVEQTDLEALNLENLQASGLIAAPQGPKKLSGELLEYITNNFNDLRQVDFFPEIIDSEIEISEGVKQKVIVNRYERSSIARAKCIDFYGLNCCVCGINFEHIYGELGKGFIHVHHLTPLHEIDGEYKISYKNDLRPVCPNCHSMLHRKIDGKYLSIEELKIVIGHRKSTSV